MGRRRRNKGEAIAVDVIKLLGVIGVATLISPTWRQFILGLGALIFWIVLVGLLAVVLFAIYRYFTWSPNPEKLIVPASHWELNPEFSRQVAESAPAPVDPIAQLRAIDWFQFEKLVEVVYRKHGYSVTRRGGANPDGGIDLLIEKDGQRCAVQCKQWKTWNVGVKTVREFLGALTDAGISQGVFITLSGFTSEAKQLAEKHGIEIIDETGLAKLIAETDTWSDPEVAAILDDQRKFCPRCEAEMVLRTAMKGGNAGRQFWGCSTYPRCRYTLPVA